MTLRARAPKPARTLIFIFVRDRASESQPSLFGPGKYHKCKAVRANVARMRAHTCLPRVLVVFRQVDLPALSGADPGFAKGGVQGSARRANSCDVIHNAA